MAKTQHRSLRGKVVDMDMLQKKNELTPAVGNARVNARGDQLGAGGQIIKTRDAVVKEYYNNNVATESSGVAKKASAPVADVIVEPQPKKAAKKVKKPEITKEEQDMFNDFDDDWIEDKDGNFVQKGK
jgi:hypothetical protein